MPGPARFGAGGVGCGGRDGGKQRGEVQTSQVAFAMMTLRRRHRVGVNATFTMVNIAIAVTEGIGKQLAPDLDLMTEAAPFFAGVNLGAPVAT